MTHILISIHPEHVERIESGEKTHEFRDYKPKQDFDKAIVYTTKPVGAITHVLNIGDVVERPEEIPEEGAGNEAFNDGEKTRFAYPIRRVRTGSTPISLEEMRDAGVSAPQSYSFVDDNDEFFRLVVGEFFRDEFQEKILAYYREEGRAFPWRETDNDLHALVAEILLQQTSYYQVLPVYEELVSRYDEPGQVLEASSDELRSLFDSLGLYNRYEYLVDAARFLESGEELSQENLLGVKGVGRYTANAFLSVHKGERLPIVDGNVVRVFDEYFDVNIDGPPSQNEDVWRLAWTLLPDDDFRDYNLGLLDYGAELYGGNPD